jgi:hypothetical protein
MTLKIALPTLPRDLLREILHELLQLLGDVVLLEVPAEGVVPLGQSLDVAGDIVAELPHLGNEGRDHQPGEQDHDRKSPHEDQRHCPASG